MVADMKLTFWYPTFKDDQFDCYKLGSVKQGKKWTSDGVQVCHGYQNIRWELARIANREIRFGHPALECVVCGMTDTVSDEFIFEMVFRDINGPQDLHAAAQKAFRRFIRHYIKQNGLAATAEAGLIKPCTITPEERERRDKRRTEENKTVMLACKLSEARKILRILGKEMVVVDFMKTAAKPSSPTDGSVLVAAQSQGKE